MNQTIAPKMIRQLFVLSIILFFGILIFSELLPYFSGILGAITMHVLLRNWMQKLVKKGWNASLAALLLMLFSFVCILLPISGIVIMLSSKVKNAANNLERIVDIYKKLVNQLQENYNFDLSSNIDYSEISSIITNNLQGFAGSTFTIFLVVALMYFLLFYMLTNRNKLRETLFEYLPISEKSLQIIGSETQAMVRSNAIGIPLVAISQGLIALLGFLLFGVEDPFFWFVVVTIGSMIPFIGTLLGILPVFLLTLFSGNTFAAWGILIYGIVVVGSTDNIIRLYLLKKIDDVHPIITVIGVIVGVPLFGFIGLIFGPLLISLFLIVVKIYKNEFGAEKTSEDKAVL